MVLEWLQNGINLPFESVPPRFLAPNNPECSKHEEFMDHDIKESLESGAILECPPGVIPYIVSPLNVAPKKGSAKWRRVINMRFVNSYVRVPKFKLEGHPDVPLLLKKDDWMFTLDFKSGYFHVEIKKEFWKYFGFSWKGKYYYFMVLPFGLNLAPYIFTVVVKQVLKFWRADGVRVMGYFDDLLFIASSWPEAMALFRRVVADLDRLGWVIAWDKSMRHPAQKAMSLDLEIDSVVGKFFVPEQKMLALLAAVEDVLEKDRKRTLIVRDIARVTGRIVSLSRTIFQARWGTVELYRCMAAVLFCDEDDEWDFKFAASWRWNCKISLSCGATEELVWWKNNARLVNGKDIWTPPISLVITTDAAGTGWGAWSGRDTARGPHLGGGSTQSSNWKELSAVLAALETLVRE